MPRLVDLRACEASDPVGHYTLSFLIRNHKSEAEIEVVLVCYSL
jgi:hypothetical protein